MNFSQLNTLFKIQMDEGFSSRKERSQLNFMSSMIFLHLSSLLLEDFTVCLMMTIWKLLVQNLWLESCWWETSCA